MSTTTLGRPYLRRISHNLGRLGASLLLAGALAWGGCSKDPPDFEPILAAEDARQVDAEALTQGIISGDARLRARAALAYGRIADPAGIDPLLGRVEDKDATVRGMVAFSLGQFGWFASREDRAADIVAALVMMLSDRDVSVRARAVTAMGKIGEPGEAAILLMQYLSDESPEVRIEAALALHRSRQLALLRDSSAMLDPLPEETFKALAALANDPEVTVRRAAVYYFSRNQDARGIDLAQQRLRDDDATVRLFAVLAIKRINNDIAAPALLAYAEDKEYTVRVAVAQALQGLKKPESIPMSLYKDPSFHVRAAVATASGDTDKLDEMLLLRLYMSDPSTTVKAAALSSLAKRRKTMAAPLLNMAFASDQAEIRAAAMSSAGVLDPMSMEPEKLLKRGLADPSELVRTAAVEQLASIEAPWAYEAIKVALKGPGLAERGTAAAVLSKRMEPDRAGLAWVTFTASSGHRWRDVRQVLLDVLKTDLSEESTNHLRTAAVDSEASVALYARRLLLERGANDLPLLPTFKFVSSPFLKDRFAQNPRVKITTTRGAFEIECFAEDAPVHVASFVGLVRKAAYTGLLWHRVVSNFVIQGGDPEGSGWGDAGFSLRAEINEHRFERGSLGMPRSDDFDSGGSQLFFNHIPTPHLDFQYTVFGQIRSGLEVVDQIEQGDRILTAQVVE